ncbi:hypothetical protein GLW08_16465 [Pontibacillus yanchengensis]|uniref:Uncharacterized protein n=1 Tax=Pontibacillus yanchengensis TaxID=462910 RepID=A0ACC7VL81_9BACI|nr:hypothetical protein [Pontibacillus yanchengensis]MYL54929.1 hypothetical protein [Pontibacillus yanchengensis]
MKRTLILVNSIIVISVLFGCSTKKEQFNDENIIFNVIDIQSTNEFNSYKIKISNKTEFDLTHLSLDLSYPIKTVNGSKSNPFVVEGEAENTERPVKLKSGEAIQFSIIAPINEVFSDKDLLDFENPSVKLQGYFKEENTEVPFGISGGLRVLVDEN